MTSSHHELSHLQKTLKSVQQAVRRTRVTLDREREHEQKANEKARPVAVRARDSETAALKTAAPKTRVEAAAAVTKKEAAARARATAAAAAAKKREAAANYKEALRLLREYEALMKQLATKEKAKQKAIAQLVKEWERD